MKAETALSLITRERMAWSTRIIVDMKLQQPPTSVRLEFSNNSYSTLKRSDLVAPLRRGDASTSGHRTKLYMDEGVTGKKLTYGIGFKKVVRSDDSLGRGSEARQMAGGKGCQREGLGRFW